MSKHIYGIIYKVTNIKNNKVYIGQTTRTLNKRKLEHYSNSCGYFGSALKKHSENTFVWEAIDFGSNKDELDYLEVYYINKYNSFGENGYNLTTGGSDCFKVKTNKTHSKSKPKDKMQSAVNRLIKSSNLIVKKEDLFYLYKYENPEWDDEKCMEKATIIFKEINNLNSKHIYHTKKYYDNNIPFSTSPLLEEGNFEDFQSHTTYRNDLKNRIHDKIISKLANDDE